MQAGQTAGTADTTGTTWFLRNWSRAEVWRVFMPTSLVGDPGYAFAANRLQAGVRRRAARYEVLAAMQYVQFGGLPVAAAGGTGAAYYAHAGRTDSHQVYLRYLALQLKELLPGLSVQVGRMPYASGGEAASGRVKTDTVKRQRIEARLVGEFDWSLYQRGFDGLRVDLTKPAWTITGTALHPTQGGFEDAAGLMMNDITVIGGVATIRPEVVIPGVEWQAFAFRYTDDRAVAARPDNSGRGAAAADVGITTFGTTLVGASSPRAGRQWDGLLWLAGQSGRWYEQTHRALSVAVEAGHEWGDAPWRPWIRAGFLRASGDDDPADERHGTFFQMLPTVRRYSQTASYSQMNLTDLFAQAFLRPAAALGLRLDVHRIALASPRDHWYVGSGATQARGTHFGFATLKSNGQTHLGTAAEMSADYTFSPNWSINAFLGALRGGDLVRTSFRTRTLTFGYIESVLQY